MPLDVVIKDKDKKAIKDEIELEIQSLRVGKSGVLTLEFSQNLIHLPIDVFNSTEIAKNRMKYFSSNYEITEVFDIWVKDLDFWKDEGLDKSIEDFYLIEAANKTVSIQLVFADITIISPEFDEIDSLYVVINRTDLFVSAISGKPLSLSEAS